MALVKTALPATLPATQRKTLANASVGTLMGAGIFRESVTPESLIAPRDLVATPTLALTGLGVGASPLSIVQGLITLAVRHAHGNAIDGVENLPPAARIGLQATLACLKKGAGCRPNQLEEAAKAGIEAMLALPAPAKKAVTTKASTPEATPEVPEVPEAPEAPEAPETPETPETSAPIKATPEEWIERSRQLAERTAQICAEAEKQIPVEISTEEMVEVVAKRDDAETILRTLAKQLGYRVVLVHKKVV
ncbi:MAG: hypothetical protein IPH82_21150 [Chloroflexi bacterium]|nr:hypothetical protein [Chloroflexota bacterium]